MTYFSRRLLHVLTPSDLAVLVTPTYAEAVGVDEDEALERLQAAVKRAAIADDLYRGLSAALTLAQGTRSEDQVMDALSKGVARRVGKMKPLTATPAVSALMVRINVEIGQAPEALRATLDTDKGRVLLADGLRALSDYLVKSLVK